MKTKITNLLFTLTILTMKPLTAQFTIGPTPDNSTVADSVKPKSRLTIGGYGEAVYKYNFYSDNMFRYSHAEKYADAKVRTPSSHALGTRPALSCGAAASPPSAPAPPTVCTTAAPATSSKPSCGTATAKATPAGLWRDSATSARRTAMPSYNSSMPFDDV